MTRPAWFPDWPGETVVIVGAGPTAAAAPLHLVRGRARVIVINTSWRLAPWADLLYAADYLWWEKTPPTLEFTGLRVSCDERACERDPAVHLITVERQSDRRHQLWMEKIGHLGNGLNGGFQAVNLAAQARAARIVLVGFDMHVNRGEHWHGRHPQGMNNPAEALVARWRKFLDWAAPKLTELGVEVVNATPGSALTAYPFSTLATLFPEEMAA